MREVSATDAARRFSELLDSVENDGERFVVVRRGRAIASIGPAVAASGRSIKDALRANPPDDDWAGELRELRQAVGGAPDPWHD